MCPNLSWNKRDACRWSRPEMSCKYFFEGVELSIVLNRFFFSKFFQWRCHHFFNFSLLSWQSVEMLRGSFLWRSRGRNLASLEEPWATSLASSSARLLGLKSQWPGTQCSCKSTSPLGLPFHWIPSARAWCLSSLSIRLSCFECRCLAEWWMASSKYCPECERLFYKALITTWLSVPRTVGWVSRRLRPLSRWRPMIRPTPSASYTVCSLVVPR